MHDLDRVVLETTIDRIDMPAPSDDPAEALLAVTDDDELEQFLGSVLRSAAGAARRAMPGSLQASLTRYLKGAAASAIPSIGTSVGRFAGSQFGDARAGARAGRHIARSLFSREFESEFDVEGDQELEAARRVVDLAERLGHEAAATAAARPSAAAIVKRAESAVVGPSRGSGMRRSGTWSKRGRTITIRL